MSLSNFQEYELGTGHNRADFEHNATFQNYDDSGISKHTPRLAPPRSQGTYGWNLGGIKDGRTIDAGYHAPSIKSPRFRLARTNGMDTRHSSGRLALSTVSDDDDHSLEGDGRRFLPLQAHNDYDHVPHTAPVIQPAINRHPPNGSVTYVTIPSHTLIWDGLDLWMGEEYVRRVCSLMRWDDVVIEFPATGPDADAANPGYCLLNFPTQSHADSALLQVSRVKMVPGTNKPFLMRRASVAPASAPLTGTVLSQSKEYSIFVGDLSPEVSSSDLVAVFRNPVLGLRNDREPKFIQPFLSCKSAKIMLDPSTGISRGYGFVRFSDEADQRRALVEMHGLYCLSRPMRISPATAKCKLSTQPEFSHDGMSANGLTYSLSSPASGSALSITSQTSGMNDLSTTHAADETWKHEAQALAFLNNFVGPNGEQRTSTDPYNTTVFVGGLSPLVSEDTLRMYFAPFGDIHYVKVPTGKNCGFVQFVHKDDAERAIEKMQNFLLGGSRIRLSWGHSQYKAAKAAAQAAQAAAIQATQAQIAAHSAFSSTRMRHAPQPVQETGLVDVPRYSGLQANGNDHFLHKMVVNSPQDPFLNTQLRGYGHRDVRIQPPASWSLSPDKRSVYAESRNISLTQPEIEDHHPTFMRTGTQNGLVSNNVDASTRIQARPPTFLLQPTGISQPSGDNMSNSYTSAYLDTESQDFGTFDGRDHGLIQDLNGTLASLDLETDTERKVFGSTSH